MKRYWFVVLMLAFGASTIAHAQSPWPIEWVRLEGDLHHVSAEQVRGVAAPLVGSGFFGVRLHDVQSAVEALPWIKQAGVRKVWPDTVVITIAEHEPMVRWLDGQIISRSGDIFTLPAGAQIQTLPSLDGPENAADQMVAFFQDARTAMAGTGLDVARVYMSTRGAWTVELSGGQRLALGSVDPVIRLERFRTAWLANFRADPRVLHTADLRYPSGVSVRWVEQGAVALEDSMRGRADG